MGYNEDDNRIIKAITLENESKKSGYEVTLNSYKEGEPKVGVTYFYIKDDQRHYPGLTRMNPDMAEKVAKAIMEICGIANQDNVPF